MQYASGYTLDLYCDHEPESRLADSIYVHGEFGGAGHFGCLHDEFPHQFIGETFAECARAAQRRGWVLHQRDRTATCPKCSGKKRRPR